jgi:drug/metabolite transporter (DMT)-like permease
MRTLRFTVDDLWLTLMVGIWGLNLSVLKWVFRDLAPLPFNSVRFLLASLAFVILIRWREGWRALLAPAGDAWRIGGLGLLGHSAYQLCFVLGLSLSSATHAGLIFGTTPLVVALLSTLKGHERVDWPIWAGLTCSVTGVALTVGARQSQGGRPLSSPAGDALLLLAVLCWALYTVHSKPMLGRYSPLRLTGLTLVIGTVPLVAVAAPEIGRTDWGAVRLSSWGGVLYSSLLALVLCYLIWYRSVARVGNARTAVYSNLVPIVGPSLAAWLLREPISGRLGLGALFILAGITLTRWHHRERRPRAPVARPPAAPPAAPALAAGAWNGPRTAGDRPRPGPLA